MYYLSKEKVVSLDGQKKYRLVSFKHGHILIFFFNNNNPLLNGV